MEQLWGIDVEGRKMRYEPWPVDARGDYRAPTDEERVRVYGISGRAVAETFEYFEASGGDAERLIGLLNAHAPNALFAVDRATLADSSRFYNNEYYFYFTMLMKKVVGRYDFHFGEGTSVQLGSGHRIYEQGALRFPPYDEAINDVSNGISVVLADEIEKAGADSNCFLAWSDILCRQRGLDNYRSGIFSITNAWIHTEFIFYQYEFAKVLLNIDDNLEIISRCAEAFRYYDITSIPSWRLSGVVEKLLNVTTSVYDIDICMHGRYVVFSLAWKKSYDRGEFSHYSKSVLETTNKVVVSGICAGLKNILKLDKIPVPAMETPYDEEEFRFRLGFRSGVEAWPLAYGAATVALSIAGIAAFWPEPVLGSLAAALALAAGSVAFLSRALREEKRKREISEDYNDRNLEEKERYIKELQSVSTELQTEKLNLEAKVRERTAELAEANDKLKELDRAKTNFFYNVSHELRTPLTLIAAPLEEIAAGRYGRSLDPSDRVFQVMRRNCDRLKRQVGNLLDFGKVEQGKMLFSPRPRDLGALVGLYAAELESAARLKGLRLEYANEALGPAVAEIDDGLFEKAFFNLASNAVKFTGSGGWVLIRLSASGEEVRVSIADSGIGIASERLQAIFERFGQADDSSTRRYEGTGIGLSLTRELVALHGGRIEVRSEPGKGSEFAIALPRSARRAEAPRDPAADDEGSRRRSILVADLESAASSAAAPGALDGARDGKPPILLVEDNAELLEFLRASLARRFSVLVARDGREALDALGRASPAPEAIVSDIMMPVMDGRELLRRLRESGDRADLPFVFLTARASEEERVESLGDGAVDYISKPFSMPELEAKLDSLISLARRTSERKRKELETRVLEALAGGASEGARRVRLEGYGLSDREKDVALLAAEGLQGKEIASRLGLSPQRVANILSVVYRKTGTSSRAEFMRVAR